MFGKANLFVVEGEGGTRRGRNETPVKICGGRPMTGDLFLRDVAGDDLPIFFEHQFDSDANYMAAFTATDPSDREAFTDHWKRILADETVFIKTIVSDGRVVGHVLSYEETGKPEVSYWIDKAYWGRGIATWALHAFLKSVNKTRPIYARVAKDNLGSIRVLEKCGFRGVGETKGFANARGAEIEELVFELTAEERGG
jgi:RimJ/RimL family protein N-acetyltransferase